MVIFQYNLYIFGIHLWSVLYPKPCYNKPCYKEVAVYIQNHLNINLLLTMMFQCIKKNFRVLGLCFYFQDSRDLSLCSGFTSTFWAAGICCLFKPYLPSTCTAKNIQQFTYMLFTIYNLLPKGLATLSGFRSICKTATFDQCNFASMVNVRGKYWQNSLLVH